MAGTCTFQFPVLIVLLLISSLDVEGLIVPQTCMQNECPSYVVVLSGKNFEIRNYNSSVWISTNPIPVSLADVVEFYSARLLTYFLGDNNYGMTIKMTAPAIIEVLASGRKSMSFYLPKENQANPPMARGLYVQRWKSNLVAVRQFRGFIDEKTVWEQVHFLNNSITKSFAAIPNFHFNSASYIVAKYNTPFESKRMNEIWFLHDYDQ